MKNQIKKGQKTTHWRKYADFQIRTWKYALCHTSLRKCQLKQQWSTTTRIVNGQNLEHGQHQMLVIGADAKVHCLWKTVWQALVKLNILLSCDLILCSLVFTQTSWKTCLCKNLHLDFYGRIIHIAKTWKQPRGLSVGDWTNKLWYIQTMEYYLALKINELSNHEKKEHERHKTKWKQPIWKDHILHNSNYITSWKRQNCGDGKNNQWLSGVGRWD